MGSGDPVISSSAHPAAVLRVKLGASCQLPGMEQGFAGSQPSPCAGGGGLQCAPASEQLVPVPSLACFAVTLQLT